MLTDDDEVVAAYAYCNLHSIWKNQENWNKKDSMHLFYIEILIYSAGLT